MRTARLWALIGATGLAISWTAVTAGTAGATTAPAATTTTATSSVNPSFAKLSTSQVKAFSAGKRENMVVVFNNQLTSMPANKAHRQARQAAANSMQAPLVAQLKQVGATNVTNLSLLNAVSATMPASEAAALRHTAGVKEVVPNGTITIGDAAASTPTVSANQVRKASATLPAVSSDGQRLCNTNPKDPLVEPEALVSIHDASPNPKAKDEASSIANGAGVIIGNADANSLAGNPNMIRPDGQHVIIDATNPNENVFNDEFNGDVSTMAAQGTVTYTYASQLPFSNVPATCTFKIVGDATGVSILSTGEFSDTNSSGQVVATESQVIAGLQTAVSSGVNVVSESYGFGALPGATDDLIEPANQAIVAAGVVVVESAGDSGSAGTVEAPADNPGIIDVGGTNDLRLSAQADGFTKGWLDNNMTTLSSGGTTPLGDVVDLVAPGYLALAPVGAGQTPLPLPTEAFGGTSQAAPFTSGAAADVIEAYRNTHGGNTPTPAMTKQILTSTASDIGAEADQQGAGLLNVFAAVKAAEQMPGTTTPISAQPELVDTPTQLDVQGNGGSAVRTSETLYNASSNTEHVSGTYRVLGNERVLDRPVTENVSAPAAGAAIPEQGATAATPIKFNVPKGVSVLDADMRWPDPTNSDNNILSFILTDPSGKLAQFSYDFGAANGNNESPDIQHATVEHPMAGTWTAQIVWADGRGHVQSAPNTPGTYTGTVTFQASGQNFETSRASAPVTIRPHSSVTVPLAIDMPQAPGDSPESIQFTGSNGLETSVPIARRTLIPSQGGFFSTNLTSSVSRGPGQIRTFYVNVPAGKRDLDVSFFTPDHAANDQVFFYLFSPADLNPAIAESGNVDVQATDATPTPANPTGLTSLIAPDPQAGLWEIDVMQNSTTNGATFVNTVSGLLTYNQLAPVTETGLPTSASTTVNTGAMVPISVKVKNTTNHVGLFELQASTSAGAVATDVTGGNVSTALELQPGATGTLTATLSPKAAAGTAVTGSTLSVIDSTDLTATEPALGFPESFSDFHDFSYSYTVGS
jgi:hypothetical protein